MIKAYIRLYYLRKFKANYNAVLECDIQKILIRLILALIMLIKDCKCKKKSPLSSFFGY